MKLKHKITGEEVSARVAESSGVVTLKSPSGDLVDQDVAAGTALIENEDGSLTAISGPQLAAEYEEVTSG